MIVGDPVEPSRQSSSQRRCRCRSPKTVRWVEAPKLGLLRAALPAGHRRGAGDDRPAHLQAAGDDRAVPRAASRRCRRTTAASTGSTGTSRAASSAWPATCARPPARPTASTSSARPGPGRPGPTARSTPRAFVIDELRCIYCGMCEEACPVDAIELTGALRPDRPEPRADDLRQGEAADRLRPTTKAAEPTRCGPRRGRLGAGRRAAASRGRPHLDDARTADVSTDESPLTPSLDPSNWTVARCRSSLGGLAVWYLLLPPRRGRWPSAALARRAGAGRARRCRLSAASAPPGPSTVEAVLFYGFAGLAVVFGGADDHAAATRPGRPSRSRWSSSAPAGCSCCWRRRS